jgi:tetratricopeptide (TPR) repeat protein
VKRALAFSLTCVALLGIVPTSSEAEETPLDRALAILIQRLEESPRDADLLTDYANLLVRGGHFDEAAATYESALTVDPDSSTTLYNLGLLRFELGQMREARRHLDRAIEVEPSFSRAHYALGSVFAARKRHRRAVQHYSRAFSLEPRLLDIHHNPELLFNDLATWASMRTYLATPTGRGTRLYNDPRPIVGLLIPGIESLLETDTPAPDPESEDDEVEAAEETAAEGR